MLPHVLSLLFGYLCGSIPSGVIITRLAGAEDPRAIGSKNIGATNVLRTGRKDLAALTLLADALKGMLAVLIATRFDATSFHDPAYGSLGLSAALGAFLGHLFPLYLGFKGGKGVATFLGCLIAISCPAALAFAFVWLLIAFATRYSSASALAASVSTPLVLAIMGQREAAILFACLAALLWLKHRANLARLLSGTESKIGQKSGAPR
jgi:glycerol-3-phosphate acyltransferase PlsY